MPSIPDPYRKMPSKPTGAALLALLLTAAVVIGLTVGRIHYLGPMEGFWDLLLVEAWGVLMTLCLVGLLMLWLYGKGVRHVAVRRYHDEIDAFRDWKSPEAAFRINGCIKQLNREGVCVMDLSRCYLRNMYLSAADLSGAALVRTDLQSAYLSKIVFRAADLNGASLRRAFLWQADLQDAILALADLRDANLENAVLRGGFFQGARLDGANLKGADLTGARGLSAEQLAGVRTLFDATLDREVAQQVRRKNEALFTEPETKK